ncbi:MAG: hypothetical protein DME25_18680, partial [Verrucomicrobia bacterium]
MKNCSRFFLQALLVFVPICLARAQQTPANTPTELFASALRKVVSVIEPPASEEPQTLSARLEILKSEALPKGLAGQRAALTFQPPDRLTVSV